MTPDDFGSLYRSWLAGIRQTTDTLEDWALVGIKRRGAVLARRLLDDLALNEGRLTPWTDMTSPAAVVPAIVKVFKGFLGFRYTQVYT